MALLWAGMYAAHAGLSEQDNSGLTL